MVEWEDLLDCHVSSRGLMQSCHHGSIGTLPERIQDFIIRTCIKPGLKPVGPLADGSWYSPVSNLGICFWLFNFSAGGATVIAKVGLY